MREILSREEVAAGVKPFTCRGCGAVLGVEEKDLYAINRASLKQATDPWDWEVAFRCHCGAENCITSVLPAGIRDQIVGPVISQAYGYR